MTDTNQPVWVRALLDKTLSPAAYRVYQYLCWRQGLNESSWPPLNMIAEDLGLTRRPIQKITKQLEKKGYLRITRPDRQGRGQYLRYTITAQRKGRSQRHPFEEERALQTTKEGRSKAPLNTIHDNTNQKKSDLLQEIFNHWNKYKGGSVCKHDAKITWHSHTLRTDGSISPEMEKAVTQALSGGYLTGEICAAIDNYAKVLLGKDYFWSYVWPMSTFLTVKYEKHKNAERKWWQFLPDNFIEENYLTEAAKRRRANQQAGPTVYELVKAGRAKEVVNAEVG